MIHKNLIFMLKNRHFGGFFVSGFFPGKEVVVFLGGHTCFKGDTADRYLS